MATAHLKEIVEVTFPPGCSPTHLVRERELIQMTLTIVIMQTWCTIMVNNILMRDKKRCIAVTHRMKKPCTWQKRDQHDIWAQSSLSAVSLAKRRKMTANSVYFVVVVLLHKKSMHFFFFLSFSILLHLSCRIFAFWKFVLNPRFKPVNYLLHHGCIVWENATIFNIFSLGILFKFFLKELYHSAGMLRDVKKKNKGASGRATKELPRAPLHFFTIATCTLTSECTPWFDSTITLWQTNNIKLATF